MTTYQFLARENIYNPFIFPLLKIGHFAKWVTRGCGRHFRTKKFEDDVCCSESVFQWNRGRGCCAHPSAPPGERLFRGERRMCTGCKRKEERLQWKHIERNLYLKYGIPRCCLVFFSRSCTNLHTFSNIFFTRVHRLLPSDGNFFYLASYCA